MREHNLPPITKEKERIIDENNDAYENLKVLRRFIKLWEYGIDDYDVVIYKGVKYDEYGLFYQLPEVIARDFLQPYVGKTFINHSEESRKYKIHAFPNDNCLMIKCITRYEYEFKGRKYNSSRNQVEHIYRAYDYVTFLENILDKVIVFVNVRNKKKKGESC